MVCTGNVCRSPLAELLLSARLGALEGVSASSAGTDAVDGEKMTAQASEIAIRLGAPERGVAEHRARRLESWMLREAELVLALTRDHRGAIVRLEPSATRRTFTLREFAHVADSIRTPDPSDPARHERLQTGVATAASLRGVVPPLHRPEDADVIDPYRRTDAVYERSAAQLAPAVESTARFLIRAAGDPA